MAKVYLLFDARFRTDEDSATCFEMCETLEEAKINAPDYGDDTVIVSANEKNNKLSNLQIIN